MSDQLGSRARLFEIAEEQAGYFTASQAREAGYSYESQNYHYRTGSWLREGWGIYRLALYPYTEGEEFVRLMLWSRNRAGEIQAVVSHDTALLVYGLSNVLPGKIHLTVPKNFRKQAPVEAQLHYAYLPDEAIRKRDGYRITTPLRTLLDVAASPLSPEHLQAATADALTNGLVRHSELETALMAAPPMVRERYSQVGIG